MIEHQGEQQLPDLKYVSLSHVIPNDEQLSGGQDDKNISIFTIPTAETMTFAPAGDVEAHTYKGILVALQGPPKTKEEVISSLGLESEEEIAFAEKVFDALEMMTIITATTGLARVLIDTSRNPAPYTPQGFVSEAEAEKNRAPRSIRPGAVSYAFEEEPSFERATTRLFDAEAPIDFGDLQRILVDSYRTSPDHKRPTPAPGGIYAVDIHVINHGERVTDALDSPALPAGVYQYDPNGLSLELRGTVDPDSGAVMAQHLTQSPDAIDPAVWVMLSVDTGAYEQKYGNASQVFLGTSIGSTMQRIIEEADQLGYGTLPLFGIQHHYADEVLQHEGNVKTILAIGIGKKASEKEDGGDLRTQDGLTQQLDRLSIGTEEIIKDAGRVNFATGRYTGMPTGFIGSWVKYAENRGGEIVDARSFGTDVTYDGALLKATAEALERMASGNVRVDQTTTSARELDASWIDPRVVMPLDETQFAVSDEVLFDPDKKLNWTSGIRLRDGSKTYAPSEMIYYPYAETEDVVMHTTSSGVAAWFGKEEAAKRGLLELIERDAIMRTWILQESPNRLTSDIAPESVAYRMNEITTRGKRIDMLDMTQDNGVPVYMAVIRSDTFPHFYTGAAAGFDPEKTMHKALDEAVVGFISRVAAEDALKREGVTKKAADVFDVDSHSMMYAADPEKAATLDWLFEGDPTPVPNEADVPTYEQLVERYNPAVFTLDNPAPGNELDVVRVIAEDLIPVQFGKVGVPYKHHTLPEDTPAPAQPHFFN